MEITDPTLVSIIQQGVSLDKAIKIKEALPAIYSPPDNLELAKRSFRELTAEARPLALATLISMLNDPETKERTKLDAARVILVDISKAALNEAQVENLEETEIEKRLKKASQILRSDSSKEIIAMPSTSLIENSPQAPHPHQRSDAHQRSSLANQNQDQNEDQELEQDLRKAQLLLAQRKIS